MKLDVEMRACWGLGFEVGVWGFRVLGLVFEVWGVV